MAKMFLIIVVCSMTILSAIAQTSADVQYSFNNTAEATPGGTRYNTVIGRDCSVLILETATSFIWNIFQQQDDPSQRKNVQRVGLFIDEMDGIAYTDISNYEIHVSASYVQAYTGDVRTEIVGILYHEMTHVWQWFGNDQAPTGLTEGIADFVRLKAGYAPAHWVKPGQGDRWDRGYDVTAWFLDYCNDLGGGCFVAELNKKMRDGYSDSFFEELLGKNVDTLWADYKAKYHN